MNGIKEIALSFCASAVFCASIGVLGSEALKKSGRYIIALIMLCTIVGTVASADIDLDFFRWEETSAGEENIEELSGFAAERLVAELLKKNNIKYEKITATVTKNEDDSIVISELIIIGADNTERAGEVISAVGIDCRVTFG